MFRILLFLLIIQTYFAFEVSNKKILFFPLQITYNDPLPVDLYSDFTDCLSSKGFDIQRSFASTDKDCNYLNKLKENNNSITLMSHSTGVNNLFKVCNQFENIDNIVIIDPILLANKEDKFEFNDDFEEFINDLIESDKFSLLKDMVFKKDNKNFLELKNVDKILYVSSKKSSRWKILPPVPPIKRFFLDYKLIKNKNKSLLTIPEYGHFDILDSQWANIIHSSISKGTNNRDEVEFYHEEIAKVIEEL